MKLMTVGYQGLQPKQFFDALLSNKVQTIVDLREYPISRKPGFSKSALESAAKKYNLSYVHLQALGSPRRIRHDYRDDENWDRFSRRFLAYLDTQEKTMRQLAKLVQNEQCCLLCFESDPNHCHRSFVAQQVANFVHSPMTITHLTVLDRVKAGPHHSRI